MNVYLRSVFQFFISFYNTTDFIYKGITVSSNAFILFFENKPLFYGVLGVVAAAIIVPTGFVIYKKKRKTKKEASEQ